MTTIALEFQDVSKTHFGPPEVHALRQANFSINSGTFVSIVGPSGSGKSTLLSLAGLLDIPTDGEIFLVGQSTTTLTEKERTWLRSQKLGFVFQQFHLMPKRSVIDNVVLGGIYGGSTTTDLVNESQYLVERVGLGARRDAYAGQLSGGEMQRVAIARALVGSPEILLCDEPTGNLDTQNSERVMELLRSMHDDGYTVIIVTHDNSLAQQAEFRFRVEDGIVHES